MKEEVIAQMTIEKERVEFKKLIIQNPNYFGTFPEIKIKPILPMMFNTKYEELRCIGFHPERNLLEAIIDVKLPCGYKGDLCSSGSFEYIRFYADWDGDGDFTDPDEDLGIKCVNVHDIPDGDKVCLDKTKPLSYAVTIKIDPKKLNVCTSPKLVKVRAILSWDYPPPTGKPNFPPTWGNVIERWIQITPVVLLLKDIISVANLEKLGFKPTMVNLDIPISKAATLTTTELKEIYKDKNVPEHRFDFPHVLQMAENIIKDPSLMTKGVKIDPKFIEAILAEEPTLIEEPNTRYEELFCVGLNYDLNTLVATMTVKLSCGYSGNLCTNGSHEYVAFWAYVWDQIEHVCYWKYLGTSSVNVHDIPNIPPEGLQYAVYLPVDISSLRDKCSKPKILKVRAILSWQTLPPTNNPNYNPVWGNKVDALIQLKPTTEPVGPGQQIPFISVVGGMAVESISGNGYANGPSVYGGYTALESPFGGVIAICGHISNPPNDPDDINVKKLQYKVQYKKVGTPNWQNITNTFTIWISKWDGVSWSMSHQDQSAPDGYYKYEEDLTPPVQRFVEGDVLAQWYTPVSDGDGLYEIWVLLKDATAPLVPGVPAGHRASNVVMVRIDNNPPKAEVSLDAGPCTKFKVGDTITGKFTATDAHIDHYSLAVEPSVPNPPTIEPPSSETYPTLLAPGKSNWPFKLTTTSTVTPCGYVIHLHVWDRTIINNSRPGNYNGATVGLCLLEKEK